MGNVLVQKMKSDKVINNGLVRSGILVLVRGTQSKEENLSKFSLNKGVNQLILL